MDKNQPKKEPKENSRQSLNAIARYSGMAFQIAATIVIFLFLGKWLDSKFNAFPVFTTALSITGVFLGVFLVIRDVLKQKMKELHKKFILQLAIISIVVYGVLYVVFTRFIIAALPLLIMVSLLFAVNSLAFIAITNTKEKKPGSFVYSYMAVSLGEMLVCAAFVFSYALTHRQDARTFALTFFLYFLYTMVEVRAIYAFFKK